MLSHVLRDGSQLVCLMRSPADTVPVWSAVQIKGTVNWMRGVTFTRLSLLYHTRAFLAMVPLIMCQHTALLSAPMLCTNQCMWNAVTMVTILPQIVCGRWLINGYPKVILFDLGSAWKKLSQWRKELYELCNIGWPDGDTETHNALVFGNLVCWFISEVGQEREG